MFWYVHGIGGWGWLAMSAGMIFFWAAIIALGVLLYRALARPGGSSDRADDRPLEPAPERILAERFARGDIDEDEYHRRLTVLVKTTGGVPRPGRQ
ncbi:SHOCT domain-containing protein [Streptomyces sp. NPDC096012]|uniref:SHOCT domain-containing protein n=1 Tax=Streptomyces sp. NPDC096012 TaxID=3155684 RepID=UPI00336A1057